MTQRYKLDSLARRAFARTPDDRRNEAMETAGEPNAGFDGTVPSQVADFDVEVRAMFERVRLRLGMTAGGPERIGRYELRDWIAGGGMGQVYRAYHVELERDVALKLIAPRPGHDPEVLRERLKREAKVLAKLDHDNVVRVYDSGVYDGQVYLVMELVEGPTLRELQTAGQLSTTECLRLYAEAARGLHAAHEAGVVHRDFKPDNVFVSADKHAKVGDFGLAYLLGDEARDPVSSTAEHDSEPAIDDDHSSLTQPGEVLGTPVYMAPEQLRSEPAGARADQFGFCVALWEALTGERPFAGTSSRTLLAAMDEGPRNAGDIDGRLCRALRTGLALAPEERHASMAELVAAIEELRGRPAKRRRWALLGGLGAVALAGVVGAAFGFSQREQQQPCPLADEIASLRKDKSGIIDATGSNIAANDIHEWLDQMETEARGACKEENEDEREHKLNHTANVLYGMKSLLTFIETQPESRALLDSLGEFRRDFVARASVPMTTERERMLSNEIGDLEDRHEYSAIANWCEKTEEQSQTWRLRDRAELLMRCARAQSLVEPSYTKSVDSYKQARRLAEQIGDGQRRLEANLGAAEVTIMRIQNYDRGSELLDASHDLLGALDIDALDPRRAQHYELSGIIAREQEEYGGAMWLHVLAIAIYLRSGTTDDIVAALTNLGNAFHGMGDVDRAIATYRIALAIQPDDPEAGVALGCTLYNEARDDAEARRLLASVRVADEHDLELNATLCLMGLLTANEDEPPQNIRRHQKRLKDMLLEPEEYSATPTQIDQGWGHVALAYATLGEFGSGYERARAMMSKAYRERLDDVIKQNDLLPPKESKGTP